LGGINSAGESVNFQYGPNRQRWQTIYTGSIGTETTYHVGKLLEKVSNGGTTTYRHYIYAGSEPVAVYNRNSAGTNTLNYTLEDHQGSIASLITNSTPGPVADYVSESFTAYGNRRSGETWSGPPTSGDETLINGVSRQGYTWQTALGVSMGLNHMNGRVEDAITGRFLSPDPYVQDPGNTQSFNRYSYANNNPLTYTDPTGFDYDCGDACDTYTGSAIPGVGGFGPSACSGNCAGFSNTQTQFSGDMTDLTNWYAAASNAINTAVNNGNGASGTTASGVTAGGAMTGGIARQSGDSAQSQTCSGCGTVYDPNDITAGISVTASAAAPAFFLGDSTMFFAPAGTNFQALWQLGRQFAAQGLSAKQLGVQIANNPLINFQILSKAQGLGYGFYQDAANFAVGVVSEGFFDGSYIGWAEMSGGGQIYGAWNATNWNT
jgi:RHS repeat-associated protein